MDGILRKVCKRCGKPKALASFRIEKSRKGKRANVCGDCKRKASRASKLQRAPINCGLEYTHGWLFRGGPS